jgi:hypothetical protein
MTDFEYDVLNNNYEIFITQMELAKDPNNTMLFNKLQELLKEEKELKLKQKIQNIKNDFEDQ